MAGRKSGPIIEAACWAHGRRKFYELAELQKAPIAIETVHRIDELFAIEREINGLSLEQRLEVRLVATRGASIVVPCALRVPPDRWPSQNY